MMTEISRERTYSWSDPAASAEKALAAPTGIAFLQSLANGEIPQPPMARTLDFDLTGVGEGTATFTCTPSEFHYNPIGVVHGGLAATLLDSAMGCAVMTALGPGEAYTTLELKVNLTRAITATTGELTCTATVVHRGSRVATAEGRITDGAGKLYAHGSTTCLVMKT